MYQRGRWLPVYRRSERVWPPVYQCKKKICLCEVQREEEKYKRVSKCFECFVHMGEKYGFSADKGCVGRESPFLFVVSTTKGYLSLQVSVSEGEGDLESLIQSEKEKKKELEFQTCK